jgi:urease accessory protein
MLHTPDLATRSATNSLEDPSANPCDRDLQRADGSVRLVVSGSETGNRIVDIVQRSPVRVILPRIGGSTLKEAVLINTGGGVAGGDRLNFSVTTISNASIAVTTQAAEKVYRALDEPARIATKLEVLDAARLAWLPQETIIFNSARLWRETAIELTSGATLLALECLVLGRVAHEEKVVSGQIIDSWRVRKDGQLIWADTFRLTDPIFHHAHKSALLEKRIAIATLVYCCADCDKRLGLFRDIASGVDCDCAATSVAGLVIVRFAAIAPSNLRLALRAFLERLQQDFKPAGPFGVPKMWLC